MKQFYPSRCTHLFFSLLTVLALLLALPGRSFAQVYFTTSDASTTTNGTNDAVYVMGYTGTNPAPTTIVTQIATIPVAQALDKSGGRLFVYEGLTASRSIKIVNLSNGATTSISISSQVTSMEYDAINDYLYLLTTDGTNTTIGAGDALARIVPAAGATPEVLVSSLTNFPAFLALDIAGNRVFVADNNSTTRSIKTVNLTTKAVTQNTPFSIPLAAIDYDATKDLIYLLTTDLTASATAAANDALYKLTPGDAAPVLIKSAITGSPARMALDITNNRAFVYEALTANKSFLVFNLSDGSLFQDIDLATIPQVVALNLAAPAALTTATPGTITTTTAVLGGAVVRSDATVTERGVVYSTTNQTPTTSDTKNDNGSGTGTFSETISGLTAGTTYYVRAYAISSAGTGYGDVETFTTAASAPTVTTAAATSVTINSAVLGGNVTANGGATVTERGVVYSTTNQTPTTSDTKNDNGSGTGTFSETISGLTAGTTYYVRAYATNSAGTSYGSAINFTTPALAPTVTTATPTSITSTSAVLGGNVSADGGATVTGRGVVYSITSTNGTPAIGGTGVTATPNGSGTGSFSATISGLTPNTSYSVRAYATNAQGTSYGAVQTFTTTALPTVVSVTGLTPSPTATATVSYQVVFSGTVSGLSVSNFNLTTSGFFTTPSVSSVTAVSGSTYTVVVNTGAGDGTLRLNVNNSTGVTPTISNVPYTSGTTYTITKGFAAAPTLRIQAAGSASNNGDVTAFVDVVQVLQSGTSTVVPNGLQNGSFETNNVPSASFKKTADGVVAAPWSFTGTSGVARYGSLFDSQVAGFTQPLPPNGDAVALLQSAGNNNASISQNLAVPTGSYQVNFQTIQRYYTAVDQRLNVFVNDVFVGSIQPNTTPTYESFTSAAFNVFAPVLTATVSSTAAPTGGTTNTTPIPFAVDFSQSVGTTFTDADVTVTNGTVTSFSGSGSSYTFTVTPTTFGTATTVSLVAGVAQDANNTLNSASNAYSVTYNQPTTPTPSVTIPSNGATTNSTPTSLGSAVVGSTVRVYIDGVQVGAAVTPNSGGTWIRTYSGTPLTSGTHTIYATAQLPGQLVSAPSASNTFTVQVPATYSSSSATQASTARVVAGSTNQEILRVAIVIGGGPDAPISATSFTFTTTGSTTPADISSARVYYTGTNSAFATASPFGNATANPNGTFTITGTRQLVTGTNYFWLAYDVAANATNGNVLDATAPSFTLFDGSFPSTRNPSTPAPAGSRQIVRSTRVAGTALRFSGDATPGYVDFSASTTPAPVLNTGTGGAYSQVAWIKPAIGTTSATYYVLGNGTGNSAAPYIYVTGNGRLGAGFGTGSVTFNVQTGPNTISADEWHYVGATYNGATLTIYLDGENVGSVSASGTPAATRVNFIGNIAASASNNFPGDIDEVSQWSRALGQIELRRMRHLTLVGTELGLVSYTQFNDNGTTTLDVIANATGTLTGATRIASTAPVSSGTFNLQVVTANTTYTFPGTNVSIAFTGVTGSSETVVFRLDGKPLGTQPAATGLNTTYTPAYWIVDKYTGGTFTSANVTYTLTPADISATDAATPANLKLFKRGSNADGDFDAPISATAANAAAGTVTFPVTSFSQTIIGTVGNSPLPVELTEFTATAKGNTAVRLAWTTASEKNSASFEVQRSLDGRTFAPIGTVAAAGSSLARRSYGLLDAQLPAAATVLYYRLRQLDQDGTASLSPVRAVPVAGAAALQLFPNPTTGAATLTGATPGAVVTVLDALGRPVLSTTADAAGAAKLGLPAGLPAGIYVVRSGSQAVRLVLE